ncbi:Protein of unknown function [Pyronema omphalodes CBS 100304]|uniref:Uncharacterized protein n=1 Tax=Pyronema omphalodes (strain CBS 100304) TaxID=1076935 RepID=U4LFJ2_PYROM|nr:Protein of unknown function [Pyronema omphalodes CBS 100304]
MHLCVVLIAMTSNNGIPPPSPTNPSSDTNAPPRHPDITWIS